MSPTFSGAIAKSAFVGKASSPASAQETYQYQAGFGNIFATEAIPGVLPLGQNHPQKVKYDLYHEGINGTPFVGPRHENLHTDFYRIRPSMGHNGFTDALDTPDLESSFVSSNPKVRPIPSMSTWSPFDIPATSTKVDFVDGLKSIGGGGDPGFREGVVVHMYLANTSMGNKAYCDSDGEQLIVPQQGRLDIQTEMGKMMVSPGEIVVIPCGIRFKVLLPDGPSRGYIYEIFGSQWTLPELGPLGGRGMADPSDFKSPFASFDLDESHWDIVYKLFGKLYISTQAHTPFDVVAWRGRYTPYKYDLKNFVSVGSLTHDHMDPSVFTVLTSKSKSPGVPLADFCILAERWAVATRTFRPGYFHRNAATEIAGVILGSTSNSGLSPGGLYHTTSHCPHGPSYNQFVAAREADLQPQIIVKGTLITLFESCLKFSFTEYATKTSGKLLDQRREEFKPLFLDRLDEVNRDLKAAGLPGLGEE